MVSEPTSTMELHLTTTMSMKPKPLEEIYSCLLLLNKTVFLRFDIENGGGKCGIIQISCECFQILNREGERWGIFD